MKSTKRLISVIAAIAMLVSAIAVSVSMPAAADNTATDNAPEYFMQFSKDNFMGYTPFQSNEDGYNKVTDMKEPQVTYLDNGTVNILQDDQRSTGLRPTFKLDQDAVKKYKARLEKEAQERVAAKKEEAAKNGKTYEPERFRSSFPTVYMRVFLDQSYVKGTAMVDRGRWLQSDISYAILFKMKDGSIVKTYPKFGGGGVMYSTHTLDISFCKLKDDSTYEAINMEDVEGIVFEFSHWNASVKEVTFSSPTVSGDGWLPEREPIDISDVSYPLTAAIWDKNYMQAYEPKPDQTLYSPDGVNYHAFKLGWGWMQWVTRDTKNQYQEYYWVDRDVFDKALAVANQKDADGKLIGSGKMKLTVALDQCTDQNGDSVQAEIKITFNTNSRGYVTKVSAWQKPGESVEYEIDVSDLERSDTFGVIFNVQNWWYYDKDKNVVEYPVEGKEVEENGKKVTKKGTGVERIYISPQVRFSPITVMQADEVATSATMASTAATTKKDTNVQMEGAGYHFIDFTEDIRWKAFGNAPDLPITYFNDSSDKTLQAGYQAKTLDNGEPNPWYGGFKIKTTNQARNKQFQTCFITLGVKEADGTKTPISVSRRTQLKNQMNQALAYARGPGAPGYLAFQVRVNSAKHPIEGRDTSVECGMQFMCSDNGDLNDTWTWADTYNDYTREVYRYVNVGDTLEMFIDVSDDLDAKMIAAVHPMAQNYAILDQRTGSACGVTDVDVDFSSIYVAGNNTVTPTRATEATVNHSDADAIYALFKQLPGTKLSDYNTPEDWAKLDKFIAACNEASAQTMQYLFNNTSLTSDVYAQLLEIYMGDGGDYGDDAPDTGAASTAAPLAAAVAAIAAGYVIVKSRKRK